MTSSVQRLLQQLAGPGVLDLAAVDQMAAAELARLGYVTIAAGRVFLSTAGGVAAAVGSGDRLSYPTRLADMISADPALVAHWRMNEVSGTPQFADVGRSRLHAPIVGGVTLGIVGNFDQGDRETGATFNGTTGYASAGASAPALDFARNSPFTIAALVKPNVTRSGGAVQHTIYQKENTSSPFNGLYFGLRWIASTSQTAGRTSLFLLFGSDMSGSGPQLIRLASSCDLQNAQYYFVVVTYDGSGSASGVQMYVDGLPVNSVDDTGAASGSIAAGQDPRAVSSAAEIGRRGSLSSFFRGDLRNVAVFNECKTLSQIQAMMLTTQNAKITSYPLDAAMLYVPRSPRPIVIDDRDFESDVGDCAELVMMLNLAHRGEIDLIAGLVSSANVKAAPAYYAVLNYYSYLSLPVGVTTGSNSPGNSVSPNTWAEQTAATYGVNGFTDSSNFESAVITARRALAAQPDHSVTWITNGDLGNVKQVLLSGADQYSALSGYNLIALKVKELWGVGGNWPTGAGISDWSANNACSLVTDFVLRNWPTSVPLIIVPITEGDPVLYGDTVMEALGASNPAKFAWETFFGNNSASNTNRGWSAIAYLAIARGMAGYLRVQGANGTAQVNTSTNATSWLQAPNSGHAYVAKEMSPAAFQTQINALIKDPAAW